MGFFDRLFSKKSEQEGVVTYESEPEQVAQAAGITITASLVVNRDEQTAALHREATRLRDEGDRDGAIAALQKAQARMRASKFCHTTESWVRLPLFLQQAGRFDEAMEEFNQLLTELDERTAQEVSHLPERFWAGFAHHPRSVIYDKMRLACKRQKLPDEAAKYEALRNGYRRKHETFMKKFDEWEQKDRARKQAEFDKKYPSIAARRRGD